MMDFKLSNSRTRKFDTTSSIESLRTGKRVKVTRKDGTVGLGWIVGIRNMLVFIQYDKCGYAKELILHETSEIEILNPDQDPPTCCKSKESKKFGFCLICVSFVQDHQKRRLERYHDPNR